MVFDAPAQRDAQTSEGWLPAMLPGMILVLGLIPRVQRLDEVSFWFDEASSWKMTTFSFAEIWHRAAANVHPPLYYWVLKAWSLVAGDGPAALRLMSAFFGLLTIAGTWLLLSEAAGPLDREPTRDLSIGRGPSIVAAMLVALSPLQIDWSVQARMYSLGAALAVFSGWSLLRALRSATSRWRDWACYGILAVLFLYTHHYALFTVASQLLFAFGVGAYRVLHQKSGRGRWQTLAAASGTSILIGGSLLPWLGPFLQQKEQVAHIYWIGPFRWEMVAATFAEFLDGGKSADPLLGWLAAELALVATLAVLLCGRTPVRLIAVCFLGPLVLSVAVSHLFRNVFLARYLLFAHVYLLALMAWGVCRLPIRRARWLGPAVVLLAASVVSLQHCQRRELRAEKPGLRSAMIELESVRTRDEPVLVGNPMLHAAVLAYAAQRENIFTIGAAGAFPHYQGTPLMRREEYRTRDWLYGPLPHTVWVVEGVRWNGGTWTVSMPDAWVAVAEALYPELYGPDCRIVVRRYERVLPTVPGSGADTISSSPL